MRKRKSWPVLARGPNQRAAESPFFSHQDSRFGNAVQFGTMFVPDALQLLDTHCRFARTAGHEQFGSDADIANACSREQDRRKGRLQMLGTDSPDRHDGVGQRAKALMIPGAHSGQSLSDKGAVHSNHGHIGG